MTKADGCDSIREKRGVAWETNAPTRTQYIRGGARPLKDVADGSPVGIPWLHSTPASWRLVAAAAFCLGAGIALDAWMVLRGANAGFLGASALLALLLMRASRSRQVSTIEPAPRTADQRAELKLVRQLSRLRLFLALPVGALAAWFFFDARTDPSRLYILGGVLGAFVVVVLLSAFGHFRAVRLLRSLRQTVS